MKNVKMISLAVCGFTVGILQARRAAAKRIREERNGREKNLCLYRFTNEWLAMKQKNKDLSKYFKDRGYHSIAIYGMGYLGERLVDELDHTGIGVSYAIDRSKKGGYAGVAIKDIDGELPAVDAVVVTPIYDFWEIKRNLAGVFECPVISLEDIVFEGVG